MKNWLSVLLVSLSASAWADDVPRADGRPNKVQYARDIQPILSTYCFTCHGPDEKTVKGGLRLDSASGATKKLRSGAKAIVPGDPARSELIARIFAKDDNERMPPVKSQNVMKESEKELLKRWIAEGAQYQ